MERPRYSRLDSKVLKKVESPTSPGPTAGITGVAGPTTPAKPSWSQPRATGRAGAATNTAAAAPGLAHDTPAAAAGAGTSSASGQPKGSAGLGSVFYASQWRQEMLLGKALAAVTLVTLLAWALLGAPNAYGLASDLRRVGRLCGDNALTFVVFNLLGLAPATLVPLMVPAYISSNQVPLAPHLAASFVVGAFSLLLYLTTWRLPYPDSHLPPATTTIQGRRLSRRLLRATESRWLPAALLASTLPLFALAGVSNAATWADFWRLFSTSRLVHVMTLDLLIQHVLGVVFVARDSRLRGFHHQAVMKRMATAARAARGEDPQGEPSVYGWREQAVFAGMALLEVLVLLVPVIGVQLYLLVRPINPHVGAVHGSRGAAAPAGEDEEEEEGVLGSSTLHLISDRAQGLLHTSSAALRRLGRHGLDAAHAVFPEGTVVRRNAQTAKRQLRRVLSWVFQGGHIEDARVPIRQYSVSHEFSGPRERRLWEGEGADGVEGEAAAGAQGAAEEEGEQEKEEVDYSQEEEEGLEEEEEDVYEVQAGTLRVTHTQEGVPTSRRSSLQQSLSGAAKALATAAGLPLPTSSATPSPTHSHSTGGVTRSTRAAKEAARRSIAALAGGSGGRGGRGVGGAGGSQHSDLEGVSPLVTH